MKTLYIFDFDGTLFKSPEPNPSVWTPPVLGKIKSTPNENGFGWFQDTITLDHPYVPTKPTEDWYNINVVNDALNAFKNENNIVCLLTGRTSLYSNIIDRILESINLKFHHKGLKPITLPNVQRETTFEFKKRFILNLFDLYKDQINKVIVYEDRIGHVQLFNNFLSSIKAIQYQTIHVDESPKYLVETDEIQLVEYLVKKNVQDPSKCLLKKQVDYTGLILDQESRSKILSLFELPKDWLIKTHHVTLNLGEYNPKIWKSDENDSSNNNCTNTNPTLPTTTTTTTTNIATTTTTLTDDIDNNTLLLSNLSISSTSTTTESSGAINRYHKSHPIGSSWKIHIEAIGFSENALAVKVKGMPSSNIIPHVTVAIHPNAKASDSNSIRNWYPISYFKPGVKTQLNSHTDLELKDYENLISLQNQHPDLTSPSKGNNNNNNNSNGKGKPKPTPKEPSQCAVTLPSDNNKNESLSLFGTITEIGKHYYEIPKPQKNQGKSVDPYRIIQNINPELSKDEIIRLIPTVKKLINDSKLQDYQAIENHIKNNLNSFKK